MATTPLHLPVPRESPRDLKFNAGKIDEFVTTDNHEYIDRFGDKHRTIAGINYDANQAMLEYGYITKKSFEIGATLDTPNTVLQWENNGEYYRWDGDWSQPKVVPAGSTPDSAGGIGKGKWVGDATLRGDLAKEDSDILISGKNASELVNDAETALTLSQLNDVVDIGSQQLPGKQLHALQRMNLSLFAEKVARDSAPLTIVCRGDSLTYGEDRNGRSYTRRSESHPGWSDSH